MAAARKLNFNGPVEKQSQLKVVKDSPEVKTGLPSQVQPQDLQNTEGEKNDLHKPEGQILNLYDRLDPQQVQENLKTEVPENPEDEKEGQIIKMPSEEKASSGLIKIAQHFSENVAGKYSTFEFIMSVIHAVANKGRAGSLAYVGTTFGEFINNVYFAAGKKLPAFIGKPLVSILAPLFKLKGDDGKLLTHDVVGGKTKEGEENGEKISAALITAFARASGVYSVIKPLWQMISGKKADVQKITFGNSFAQIWGPIANWWAMWSASAGKTMIGNAAFKLTNKFKEGMGSLKTTGFEDIYCGLSSFALAIDSVLSTISPTVSRAAEVISGIGLSLLSMNNAAEPMGRDIWGREIEEEHEERDFPLPKLWETLGGSIGNFIYKTTEPIAKMLGGEIPTLSDIREIASKGLNKENEARIIKLADKYPDDEEESAEPVRMAA